jgi:hypothetical protein
VKLMPKFILILGLSLTSKIFAVEGCGNIAIDHFAADQRIFGAENSERITRQIVKAIADAKKQLDGVREVVTAETYQDRIGLDVLNDSTRSIRGERLDVLTSTETTEAVIIFSDGSTLRTLLEYPRPRNRSFEVLGG